MSTDDPTPEPGSTSPSPGTSPERGPTRTDQRKWYQKKRILLPVVALVAFLLGMGAGGSSEVADTAGQVQDDEDSSPEIAELTEERDALAEALDSAQEEVEKLREAQQAAEEEAPEDESGPDPEAQEAPEADTYTAGQYEITDVQVTEDFVGDFAMRARVTNTGNDISGVILKATLFSGGSAVATLDGSAQDLSGGQTKTIEFTSTDGFRDWETVEFQVDVEF